MMVISSLKWKRKTFKKKHVFSTAEEKFDKECKQHGNVCISAKFCLVHLVNSFQEIIIGNS